jgi:ribonuclease HI/endonuclease/exonuclease/phosphatase family metal-dependent hydrolase
LKRAGDEYTTSIRVLNVNKNKDHSLSTFLEEAKCDGECLAVVTQAALCTRNKNFKVEADKLRRHFKNDWQVRLLPSDSDSHEGMVVFSRGGWNIRRVENIAVAGSTGRLAVIRGLDPGGNPVSLAVVQFCVAKATKHRTLLETVALHKKLHKELMKQVDSFPKGDLCLVAGDFNAVLRLRHRLNYETRATASGNEKLWNDLLHTTVAWLKEVSFRSAEDDFLPENPVQFTYQKPGGPGRCLTASKIDHAFYRQSQNIKLSGHAILSDSKAGSDHFPLQLTYTARSQREYVADAAQTTKVFNEKVLEDEVKMDEFNDALDEVLRRLELEDEGMDGNLREVLDAFHFAIRAVFSSAVPARLRQSRYLTKAVRALKSEIRNKSRALFAAQRAHRDTAVQTRELRGIRKQLKNRINKIVDHENATIAAKLERYRTNDKERHRLLKVQCNVSEPLRELKRPDGVVCRDEDLIDAATLADQDYCDRLKKEMTQSDDAENGDCRWLHGSKFPQADEARKTCFLHKEVDKQEMLDIMSRKAANSSPGWDGATVGLMKVMSDFAWSRYLKAVNHAFRTQEVHPDCVASIVKHIPKKEYLTFDERVDLTRGWRPISMQPVPLKLMTALWIRRIEAGGWFTGVSQKGWKRGVSCSNAQRILLNCIGAAKVEGKELHCAFLDFAKAFDAVSHDVLERTMEALGLHEEDRRLAMAMLRGQSRRCFTARGLSRKVRPTNGVPQGASESPTLFAWFIEPLLREINANYSDFGFTMGPDITISVVAYADDVLLISESRAGLQSMLDCVGDYCKWSGMAINCGKTKSATMQVNGKRGSVGLSMQDTIDGPLKELFQLTETESYKYLGTRINSSMNWGEEVRYRLDRLKSQTAKLLLSHLSTRQIQSTATSYLEAIHRYPGPFDVFSEADSADIDHAVDVAVRECFRNSKCHISELCVRLPAKLHGLGLRRCQDMQKLDTVRLAVRHLNSSDEQVRLSTQHLFAEMRGRGLKGRHIGSGIGYLLKFIEEGGAWRLVRTGELRPDDLPLEEIPIAWLKNVINVSDKTIHFLCTHGRHTVQSCLDHAEFYNWAQSLESSAPRGVTGLPRLLREAEAQGLHRLMDAEKVRMCGARHCDPPVPDPLAETSVQQECEEVKVALQRDGVRSVLVATDGSRSNEGRAGAAFVVFRGEGCQTDRHPLTARIRVYGKQSSNRGEALALYSALKSCSEIQAMTCFIDSEVTMKGVSARFKRQFKPGHTPNLDLLDACADLLHQRRERGYSFSWQKVRSHMPTGYDFDKQTPPEHEMADEAAGEATRLLLPDDHLTKIKASYALTFDGQLLDDTDVKTKMQSERLQQAAEGLPPHLHMLKSDKLNHKLTQLVSEGPLEYATAELLIRAKFGASTGKRLNFRRCVDSQNLSFACPHCHGPIAQPRDPGGHEQIHGVQYIAHCLHDCTHPVFQEPRDLIQQEAKDFLETTADFFGDVIVMGAQDFPEEDEQLDGVFYLDLAGLLAKNTHSQSQVFNINERVLSKLFNKLRVTGLTTMFIGMDKTDESGAGPRRRQSTVQEH